MAIRDKNPNMLEAALELAEGGYSIFPLHSVNELGACTCSKAFECGSPGKHPRTKDGFKSATKDTAQITEWWTAKPDSNIGIATGASGLLVLDVDPRHGGDESLRDLTTTHGWPWLEGTISALTPSGGSHHYFTAPEDVELGNSAGLLGPGLDIRGVGGYVVAPPSRGKNGMYTWELEPDWAWAKPVPTWMIDRLVNPTPSAGADGLRPSDAWEGLPEGSRDVGLFKLAAKMRSVGLPQVVAEKAILEAAALANPPFPPAEALAKVASVYRRYQAGDGAFADPDELQELEPLRLVTLSQLKNRPAPTFLIDQVVVTGSLAFLTSKPGGGKTFIALAMSLAVATGLDFVGHETKRGPVLYVVGEGITGFYQRAHAWARHHGLRDDPENFYVLEEPVQMRSGDSVERLEAALATLPMAPALIVIDTLARSLVGGDENSARDVGEWIAGVDRLRRNTGATVLVVHHTGKAEGAVYRGSSAMEGAADTMLSLSGPTDSLELKCDKQKDSEPFAPMPLKLTALGDSLVLTTRAKGEGLRKSDLDVLAVIEELYESLGPVKFSPLLDACKPFKIEKRNQLYGALERLIKAGHVVKDGDSAASTKYLPTSQKSSEMGPG